MCQFDPQVRSRGIKSCFILFLLTLKTLSKPPPEDLRGLDVSDSTGKSQMVLGHLRLYRAESLKDEFILKETFVKDIYQFKSSRLPKH